MNRRPAYAPLSHADETRLTLGLKSETLPDGFRVTITANLVGALNAGPLRELVADALDDGIRSIVLDFTYCPYADGKAQRMLEYIAVSVRALGGTVRAENLNEDLRRLFTITHLDTLFEIGNSQNSIL